MKYYYKLPLITELTLDQQAALDEPNSFALTGGPGTGKSLVCLWRHIRNHNTDTSNSLLLTYTKTLEHFLRQNAQDESAKAAESIDRTFNWLTHNAKNYDEIIIDEGQDVQADNYRRIKRYASNVSYGADQDQSLYDHGCSVDELSDLFPDNEEYTLYKNFRNSLEILQFIQSIFPDYLIPRTTLDQAKTTNIKPIVKIAGWENEDTIKETAGIINDYSGEAHNIGILLPLATHITEFYNALKANLGDKHKCTMYECNMASFEGLNNIHVTTFKSAKGTEYDTVIIPNFDSFRWNINNLDVITENDYYVALTRAKSNLFLICKRNPRIGAPETFDIE